MKIKDSKSYKLGYNDGKKEVIEKILQFIDKESKFLPDIHTDLLLDRLVKKIKNL